MLDLASGQHAMKRAAPFTRFLEEDRVDVLNLVNMSVFAVLEYGRTGYEGFYANRYNGILKCFTSVGKLDRTRANSMLCMHFNTHAKLHYRSITSV